METPKHKTLNNNSSFSSQEIEHYIEIKSRPHPSPLNNSEDRQDRETILLQGIKVGGSTHQKDSMKPDLGI